jgi:hypothetical protein
MLSFSSFTGKNECSPFFSLSPSNSPWRDILLYLFTVDGMRPRDVKGLPQGHITQYHHKDFNTVLPLPWPILFACASLGETKGTRHSKKLLRSFSLLAICLIDQHFHMFSGQTVFSAMPARMRSDLLVLPTEAAIQTPKVTHPDTWQGWRWHE